MRRCAQNHLLFRRLRDEVGRNLDSQFPSPTDQGQPLMECSRALAEKGPSPPSGSASDLPNIVGNVLPKFIKKAPPLMAAEHPSGVGPHFLGSWT